MDRQMGGRVAGEMERGKERWREGWIDRNITSNPPHITASPQHIHQNIYPQPLQKNRSATTPFQYALSESLQAWLDCFIHVVTFMTESTVDNQLISAEIPVGEFRLRTQMRGRRADGK